MSYCKYGNKADNALFIVMGEPSLNASGNGKKSDVWDYEKIKDAPKAKCKLCNKELSYCGGTTNLRTHLECKHTLLYTHKAKKTNQYSSKQTCLDGYTKSVKSQHCSEERVKTYLYCRR